MFKTVATIRILTLLLACSLSGSAFATDITLTMSGASPYCGGTTAKVTYNASAFTFTSGNVFNVELSNGTGNFSSPFVIGKLTSTATTGEIPVTFPLSASGTGYRIRIAATKPVVFGSDNGSDITIRPAATPTIIITADPATTVGAGSVVYVSSVITEGGTSPVYEWKKNGNVVGTSNAIVIPNVAVGDEVIAKLTSSVACAPPATSNIIKLSVDNNLTKSNHAWETRASQADGPNAIVRSNGSGFTIGSKAYIGLGTVASVPRNDFWEYDPANDVWTQKANFGGVARYHAVGFSIGIRGFMGTGISATGAVLKDFWAYDQTSNTWQQRTEFPGPARERAFGFAIGSRGYIGGGYAASTGDFKDFYSFDPSSNSWTARADFGGGKRLSGATFTIEGKGFVAGGFSSSSNTWFKDLWDFDQAANLWTKRADMPGNPRTRATAFALAGNGYVGLGFSMDKYEGQFFQYLVSTNTWSLKPYYPGPLTQTFASGISIGNRAFVYKDGTWMEYNLFTTTAFSSVMCTTETIPVSFDASGFVFGSDNVFTAQLSQLPDFSSRVNLSTPLTSNASTGIVNAFIPTSVSGTYYFRIVSSNPVMSTRSETITITSVPTGHSITPENGATVCKGLSVTFNSSLTGTGFQWYKNNLPVGTDAPQYVDSSLANGDVIKCMRTYATGCRGPVGVTSNTVTMKVIEPPQPTITILTNTLTSSPAIGYQWYLNGVGISEAHAQSYLMKAPGAYKVRTTDNGGCYAFSDEVVDIYVGLEDDTFRDRISVYPNPVAGEIMVEVGEDLVMQGCNFSVVNELGESIVANRKASTRNKISLAGNSSGLYMVRFVVDGATVTRRIIKVE